MDLGDRANCNEHEEDIKSNENNGRRQKTNSYLKLLIHNYSCYPFKQVHRYVIAYRNRQDKFLQGPTTWLTYNNMAFIYLTTFI